MAVSRAPGSVAIPRAPYDRAVSAKAHWDRVYESKSDAQLSWTEADPRTSLTLIGGVCPPGGRVIDLEYRGEDPKVQIKPHHKMTEAQAIKEMEAVGLKHVQTLEDLPRQHVMIFRKPLEKNGTSAEPPAKP